MQKWPSMHVLNGSQLYWTKETEVFFREHGAKAPQLALDQQKLQLADMVVLVRQPLSKGVKTKVGALAVIDVHARDVMVKLVAAGTSSLNDFLWQSQLRYYWEKEGSEHGDDGDLWAMMVAARRPYCYEYLGNSFRLVITPLTDKCYLTLMGALQLVMGGAPAGPAGTGKTETTKDLSKALAVQCVVFNCSDGLGYLEMAKFAKGLSSCGAWACYDEFNRINIEVLSVVGQQVMEIQLAIKAGLKRIIFSDSDIAVKPGFGVFITMNPGYAGRTELPDSLAALFRPVAMMVPDYALIGEIMFFAYGFGIARECGNKMVGTFKLCSEQCSSQPHYDYGMRAVKTVIVAAGNLKSAEPDADEISLIMRALVDVNTPKFLDQDIPLYAGIMGDLFPGISKPVIDYGKLFASMKAIMAKKNLQLHPWFIEKVIQLYEMIVVRHGLMLVGPTGGGKTMNVEVLQETLGDLKRQKVKGFAYEKVIIYQLNPKSITMGQMYGAFDPNTREWQDGIMSTMYRLASMSQSSDRKWMMFNGPVDAIWIENMNTVLDDNKKLCLNSGEIMKMSEEMTMMFEVEDLQVASPATVSRVGIIYMEPSALGIDVLVQSWLNTLPPALKSLIQARLVFLMDSYLRPAINFVRDHLKELSPTVDNNLASSLMRLLDCYFAPFVFVEGKPPAKQEIIDTVVQGIDELFTFCLVWSVGATTNDEGRLRFDAFLRQEMCFNGMQKVRPPTTGDLYAFMYDSEAGKWVKWMDTTDPYTFAPGKLNFSEIVIPTTDSVRNTYLLDMLVSNAQHTLMVGETGTGKTVNISQFLQGQSKSRGKVIDPSIVALTMTFSATASANMTQDLLDSKFEKRKRGVFGPAAGKKYAIHVDDMNMPLREEYGAQPPIEILRQWFDQAGWYDRKELTFRNIVDITFVGSMGPPGGGRQIVTGRFLRHFNTIGYVEMSDESKATIFGTIVNEWLSSFPNNPGAFVPLGDAMVKATLYTFTKVVAELLPTPAKCHYIFNLRDLSKVFQGVLMGEPKLMTVPEELARLWVHESVRVFEDRMVDEHDHNWFQELMAQNIEEYFKLNWADVKPRERLLYGDFMVPGADPRVYAEIPDMDELKHTVEDYLAEHNAESKQPMPLVMFNDALMHVGRIARVIRQPQGNALLLGVGGSGRQSMTRLATYISGYNIFSVNITKGYGQVEWREDVKQCLLYAGLQDKPIVFLFSDAQVVMESMVEDINNVLNAGDVPNLYVAEDEDKIVSACRVECQRKRIPPTKLNIFAQYLIRVRRNLHVCFCMSPLGEAFRDRMRNFPSIVNCCTADWFTLWPRDALISVGRATLDTAEMQEQLGETLEPMVEMFGSIHLSVEDASRNFFESLRRRNYVTPTSYLELLSSFKSLLGMKFSQVNTKRDRLQVGLDKLSSTKEVVATLQKEIEALEPVLVVKSKEVSEMMVVITADKADAEVTKAACEVQEADANEKAAATKEIADSAQADLDKALPALAASLKALDSLKKSDIDEVKSLGKPPAGVRLTMEVCCGFFEIKADMVKDPDSGKKVPDYFGTAKKTLLSDAKAFMDMMVKYDKDNIKDSVIQKIEPFMENPDFTPDQIKKASVACTAICMWAHAMHTYHYVALGVAPKKAKLAEAQATLDVVLSALAQAKGKLATVIAKVDALEKQFNEAVAEKQALEQKAEQCQVRLSNAGKLIGGLGGEEARWKETVANLNVALRCVPGDVAVSAGSVSYLGPFTAEFRTSITDGWIKRLHELKIPNTDGCDIVQTLADPVKLRKWQLCGLPTDPLSTQNGIMIDSSRRWPLVIDPQGQCNSYVRRMGKNKDMSANGLDVVKLSEKNFLRSLENGVRFGKWVLLENVYEMLDASLEPILMQQVFKQGGQDVIKIGDNVIPYSDTFRFFMTTKMANPHYPPETQVKVSIVNFTVTESGLEDQLLDLCVLEELPDLAEKKAELVVQNAQMNGQLFDIESQILVLLAESKGNILDDTVLIETLSQAKATSEEVKAKMIEAEETGKEIYERSEEYRPVAFLASLLYFCISQLGYVDPMYQYSLPWFCTLFAKGIGEAKPAQDIEARCQSIIDYFTYMLYCNVCRSLFEQHKLMFSFLLCIKILQGRDKVDPNEWRFLISGMSLGKKDMPNPDPSWIESNVWDEVCNLTGGIPFFEGLADSFKARTKEWKAIFDDNNPHKCVFPKPFDTLRMDDPVGGLRCLCIIRCLRLDKTMACVETFVLSQEFLGTKFVEPPPINLKECFNDSSVIMPLIFILSTGSDPNKDIQTLAETMGCTDSLKSIALGQGQDKLAEAMVTKGMEKGDWVVLQNCHLFVSWMPVLEAMCEEMDPSTINPDFRLWLTSKPSPAFPLTILQNGVKMTKEPPKGLRANLRSMYIKLTDSDIVCTSKPVEFSRLLFSLSFFHAVMLERKRFGPLGWNIPYAFNDTDVDICISQLKLYVDKYDEIPYSVLQLLTSMVNYGGRITDDKDMRTSDIIVGSLLAPQVLEDNFAFSESGIYKTLVAEMDAPLASYLAYIDSLPLNAEPEVFGMHSNAAITCDINEAVDIFGIITSLQPRTSSGGGMSREDQIGLIAKELEVQMFPPWDEEKVKLQYPIDYNESMNTILGQEIAKYNLVIRTVNLSLKMLQLALKGLVVLSAELENMGNSLFNQAVPSNWEKVAYPSLKPLKPWFADFLARTRSATTQGFIGKWVNEGLPSAYWVSGFFFPQGFLTAIQQNYARQMKMPIDTVGFGYKFTEESPEVLLKKPKPKAGAYTYGLYFEGARWDSNKHVITDPRPKELFSPMPAVLNDPIQNRPITTEGIYRCPVYKILSRRGVLSTTGHSTNFVLWLEVPSDKPRCFRSSLVSETNSQVMFCDNEYWVKGGVAAFCSLRY